MTVVEGGTPRRQPFTVKDPSGKAQWEMVYDHLVTLDRGDVITYQELMDRTSLPIQAVRSAIPKAQRVLQERNHRTIENVWGVGYRIVEAREHERLGVRHHHKSVRQLRKAQEKFRSADRGELSPQEAQRMDELELVVGRQAQAIRSLRDRVEAQEAAVEKVRNGQSQQTEDFQTLDERVRRMRDALSRHNITVD